jgi:hypothetical protein
LLDLLILPDYAAQPGHRAKRRADAINLPIAGIVTQMGQERNSRVPYLSEPCACDPQSFAWWSDGGKPAGSGEPASRILAVF